MIRGETIQNAPGEYSIAVDVDGKRLTSVPFRVRPDSSELKLLGTFMTDKSGNQKAVFTEKDQAVFVYAFFENGDGRREHTNRVRATFYAPDGSQFGRVLGGDFKVKPGQDTSKVDFPRSSDPKQHNGFFIEKKLPPRAEGQYRVVVEVDGEVVSEVRYQLKPRRRPGRGRLRGSRY
ncbi:MAG: hypothetical protein FJX76_25835 [Armatimonadetes bacterium]|nr:hypothetical protein [Armatimonadota bacterium]